ncbi:MAG: insulinase family protein [Verrucomicrobia bacterium]|nr:insulinase family protein [Cytophagales bacterium]
MNFPRKMIFSWVLLWSVLTLQAQTEAVPFDAQVKTGKLANGLTYYIRKNTQPEKRVHLRLVVNAGSILEDEDQVGLAHFTEHMAFNGTKNFPKNQLVSYLQSIGVQFGNDLNAYTSFDETVYFLPVPTDKPELVDKGLQILQDWASNLTFDGAEIDKERGVILEELRMGKGADERMLEKSLPVMYKGSRYAERLPIGKKELLETFKHDVIKRYYKDWYRPDLQAVIIVGDIDVAVMEKKVQEYFGKLTMPKNPRKREFYQVPDHQDTYVIVNKDKESPFTQVQLMYKKAPEETKNMADFTRDLNYRLYTAMLNQRLGELRLKPEPPFVGAGSFYGGSWARTKNAFQSSAIVGEKGVEKGLTALLVENQRVKQFGFTASEFERAKVQMLSQYEKGYNEREKTESDNFVDEYQSHFLENEPAPGIAWEFDFVKKYLPMAKLTDINALAQKFITPENLVVVINAPDKEGVKIPTEAEVRTILASVKNIPITAYEEKALASSFLDSKTLKAGKVVKETKNDKIQTTELVLSNGVKVILKPTDFKNDEIVMQAFSPGGTSLVADADYFSANYASQVVTQSGIKDISQADMQKMMTGKNTRVAPSLGQLTEGISGATSPQNLETLLQLTNLYFTNPRKDKASFESFVSKQKQFLQNVLSNPQYYFLNEKSKILNQNHLRAGLIPTPDEFDKIDLEKAYQIYNDRFADASDFTFIFVGNFKNEEIKPMLALYLGSLPANNRKETWKDVGIRSPKEKIEKVFKKGAEKQGMVSIVFTGEAKYNAQEAYDFRSLGELMDIKLIEKIREEKGGAYSIGAYTSFSKLPVGKYSMDVQFPCNPDKVEELSKEVLKEIEKIQQEGVKAEDLQKIKEQQKRELEVNMRKNQFWAGNLQRAYFEGFSPEEILMQEKMITGLTGEAIKAVAKKYLKADKYIKVVLLPEDAK